MNNTKPLTSVGGFLILIKGDRTMGKKKKVWVDIDEVVKVSTVPPKKKKWFELMIEVPKGQGK